MGPGSIHSGVAPDAGQDTQASAQSRCLLPLEQGGNDHHRCGSYHQINEHATNFIEPGQNVERFGLSAQQQFGQFRQFAIDFLHQDKRTIAAIAALLNACHMSHRLFDEVAHQTAITFDFSPNGMTGEAFGLLLDIGKNRNHMTLGQLQLRFLHMLGKLHGTGSHDNRFLTRWFGWPQCGGLLVIDGLQHGHIIVDPVRILKGSNEAGTIFYRRHAGVLEQKGTLVAWYRFIAWRLSQRPRQSVRSQLSTFERLMQNIDNGLDGRPSERNIAAGTQPEALSGKLAGLPDGPGVYLFKDDRNQILYVGKAVVLRNRVRSYFQESRYHSPKIRALVARIVDLEWITTRTEVEALILESNLIKHHRPHFNALLKDGKHYPYLKLTVQEPFPRLMVARQRIQDGARYFGPFPDGTRLRHTLALIERLFPLRRRRTPQFRDRPCLNHHLGKCLGPCQGLVAPERYRELVLGVTGFLEGRFDPLMTRMQAEMVEAAEALDFERAARLRDQVRALDVYRQKQQVVGEPDADMDVIGAAQDGYKAVIQVFNVRAGKLINRISYQMPTAGDTLADLLDGFLVQFYAQRDDLPQTVLIPYAVDGQDALMAYLTQRRGKKVTCVIPQRGDRYDLLQLANQNAQETLTRVQQSDALSDQGIASEGPQLLAQALGLVETPRRIEAFDISHLGGTDIVASMVVFVDGKPDKAAYRRFGLKTVQSNDDFASMREVITRRFKRSVSGDWPWPDLVLIDGGKGQLNAALNGLRDADAKPVPMFGLAKREEEIFLPREESDSASWTPLRLRTDSAALYFIQRIRDEAHRFALRFQREKRNKRMVRSELDGIEGLGAVRIKRLLDQFGSVARMRAVPYDELRKRANLPETTFERLYAFLQAFGDET